MTVYSNNSKVENVSMYSTVATDDLQLKPALRDDLMGSKTFVIGDVQGDLHLLVKMLNVIEEYPLAANDKVVIMGNTVTGRHAFHIVDVLMKYFEKRKDQLIMLRGRQENIYLSERFGKETEVLNSYRMPVKEGVKEVPLATVTLAKHRKFVADQFRFYHLDNDAIYVAAGVDPAKSLNEQFPISFCYLDSAALEDAGIDFSKVGKRVIHGASSIDCKTPHRVNVCTNPLTTGYGKIFVFGKNEKDSSIKEEEIIVYAKVAA